MQTKTLSDLNFYLPVSSSFSSGKKKYVYIQKESKFFFDIPLIREVQEDITSSSLLGGLIGKLLAPFKRRSKKEEIKKSLYLSDAYSLFYEIKKESSFTTEPVINLHHRVIAPPRIFTEKAPLIKERRQSEKETINKSIKLPRALKGQLFHSPNGLLYLKVDSKLAKALQTQIDDKGEIDQSFEELYPFHGAHIPVIEPSLSKKYRLLGSVKEAGSHYFFGIKEIIREKMYNHPEIDTMWYVKVESESLSQIQKKYMGHTTCLYLIVGIRKKSGVYEPFQDMCFRTNLAMQFV